MPMGYLQAASVLLAMLASQAGPHAHHTPAPAVAEGGWTTYRHKTAGFTFEHPAAWSSLSEKSGISIHISHPTKAVHLFAAGTDATNPVLRWATLGTAGSTLFFLLYRELIVGPKVRGGPTARAQHPAPRREQSVSAPV